LSCAGNALITLSLSATPPTEINADRVVLLVPNKANYANLSRFPAGTHALLPSEYSVTAILNAAEGFLTLSADIAGTNRYQWQTPGASDIGASPWQDVTGATTAVYNVPMASAADVYRLKFTFADDTAGAYDFYTAPLDIERIAATFPNQPGLTDNPASGNVTAVPAETVSVSWTFTIDPLYDLSTVRLGSLPSGVSLSLTRNVGTVTVSGTVTHGTAPYTIDLKLSAQKTGATGAANAWYESPVYAVTVAAAVVIPPVTSPDIPPVTSPDIPPVTSPDVPPTVPDAPPEIEVTTTVTLELNSTGQIVSLAVTTLEGEPIPAEVWFKIWLLLQPGNGGSTLSAVSVAGYSSILADDESAEYYGPFLVKSIQGENGATTLDIDVNNLIKPDGTKGFIPAGSYKIQFVEDVSDPTYAGMTEVIELPATQIDDDPEVEESAGGGCDAGFGATGFVGVIMVLAVAAVKNKRETR
jgi:hypothetical protein